MREVRIVPEDERKYEDNNRKNTKNRVFEFNPHFSVNCINTVHFHGFESDVF